MKRKNIISLLLPVYLIIQLLTFSTAFGDPLTPLEDYRIVLSWSTFGSELEAVLIVPNVETGVGTPLSGSVPGETSNKYVFSTGDVPPEPSITLETFTIRKFSPG
ncbi:MAG: hypothetical protein KAX28_09790, partial [Candidatus Marinimicrobia bacterium]|nr:hypothetical protein [Candidatus Neomarinimicrobiota bacterium]